MKILKIGVAATLGLVTAVTPLLAQHMFVGDGSAKTISSYSIESNGALKIVPGGTINVPEPAGYMTADYSGRFLFATNRASDRIYAYSIGSNGVPAPVVGSPFPGQAYPDALATDRKDTYLFLLCDEGLAVYSVNGNGGLKLISKNLYSTGYDTLTMAVDPSGKFLYIPSAGYDGANAYSINSNGTLTAVPGQPFGLASVLFSLAFGSKYVYFGDGQQNSIWEFAIAKNGALSSLPGSPAATASGTPQGDSDCPIEEVVDSSGKFLYAITVNGDFAINNYISGFQIGSTGELTRLANLPIPSIDGPGRILSDPKSDFIYVTNSKGISGYAVQKDGSLKLVPGSLFSLSAGANEIVITSR